MESLEAESSEEDGEGEAEDAAAEGAEAVAALELDDIAELITTSSAQVMNEVLHPVHPVHPVNMGCPPT